MENVGARAYVTGTTAGQIAFIDATVARLLLVPATMYLFKGANWWIPGWLDRILLHFDPEGPSNRTRAAAPGSADRGKGA